MADTTTEPAPDGYADDPGETGGTGDTDATDAPDEHGRFATYLERWWHRIRHNQTAEERRSVINQLFPELDPEAQASWKAKFILLMAMSAIIATMGLLDDSPAVVVGAMLVAPLMRPVLAVAAASILGWWRCLGTALTTVAAATAGVVGAAALFAVIVPGTVITGEVLGRTSPDLTDLAVAFAAGVAGSYATVRTDISGALPGVAVAVALVPPLASAGIALEAGRSDLAAGALLLYAANLVAMTTSAAVVFAVSGMVPAPHLHLSLRRTLVVGVASALAVSVITVPLGVATYRAATSAQRNELINTAVLTWLDGTDLRTDNVRVDDRLTDDGSELTQVTVEVSGQSAPPDGSTLAADLAGRLGTPVDVSVRWTQTAPGAPVDPVPYDGLVPEATVDEAVAAWLAGQDLEVTGVEVAGADAQLLVTVAVTGPEAPPPAATLADDLSERTGTDVDVSVAWTQQRLFSGNDPVEPTETDVDVARRIAAAWAEDNDIRLIDVTITRDGDRRIVEVAITSAERPDDAADLADDLVEALSATSGSGDRADDDRADDDPADGGADGDGADDGAAGSASGEVDVSVQWSQTVSIPVTTTTTTTTPAERAP